MTDQLCSTCPHRDRYVPSPWFVHIEFLFSLFRGGYPFGKDDLTIEERQGIAMLRDRMEALQHGIGVR